MPSKGMSILSIIQSSSILNQQNSCYTQVLVPEFAKELNEGREKMSCYRKFCPQVCNSINKMGKSQYGKS